MFFFNFNCLEFYTGARPRRCLCEYVCLIKKTFAAQFTSTLSQKIFDVHNISSFLDYKRSLPQMFVFQHFLFRVAVLKSLTKGYFKPGQR